MDAWAALLKRYAFNAEYNIFIIGLHIFVIRFVGMGKGLLFLAMMETTWTEMDARLIVESSLDILALGDHLIVLITVLNSFLRKSY